MKPHNNVDDILTPAREPDPWHDHDEPSEDTGTPSTLIVGPRADELFSAAHAAGEALRESRRAERGQVLRARNTSSSRVHPPRRDDCSPLPLYCHTCGGFVDRDHRDANHDVHDSMVPDAMGRLVYLGRWCHKCQGYVGDDHRELEASNHRVTDAVPYDGFCTTCRRSVMTGGHDAEHKVIDIPRETHSMIDYHTRLYEMSHSMPKARKNERPNITAEWRVLPNHPEYIMHSVTREVYRLAGPQVDKNGRIRHNKGGKIKPSNGTYSLSANGVKASHGVAKLWAQAFPEYATPAEKNGECEIKPHRHEFDYYHGLHEWFEDGGVGIVTRPE